MTTENVHQTVRQAVEAAGGDRDTALAAVLEWARGLDAEARVAVLEQLAILADAPRPLRIAAARALAAGADDAESLERHLSELLDAKESPTLAAVVGEACRNAYGRALVALIDDAAAWWRVGRMEFKG